MTTKIDQQARQAAVDLWSKVTTAVSRAIDRRFDRRVVVEIDDNGGIWVDSLNPEEKAVIRVPRIRGIVVAVGDDVLLASFGGTPTVIGVVRTSGESQALDWPPYHEHDDLYSRKSTKNRVIASGDQLISSAGVWPFKLGTNTSVADVVLDGLVPNKVYSVDVALSFRIAGAASTSARIGYYVIGFAPAQYETTLINLPAGNNWVSWSWETRMTSDSNGVITVRPCTVWGVGSYTPQYVTCKARAEIE